MSERKDTAPTEVEIESAAMGHRFDYIRKVLGREPNVRRAEDVLFYPHFDEGFKAGVNWTKARSVLAEGVSDLDRERLKHYEKLIVGHENLWRSFNEQKASIADIEAQVRQCEAQLDRDVRTIASLEAKLKEHEEQGLAAYGSKVQLLNKRIKELEAELARLRGALEVIASKDELGWADDGIWWTTYDYARAALEGREGEG